MPTTAGCTFTGLERQHVYNSTSLFAYTCASGLLLSKAEALLLPMGIEEVKAHKKSAGTLILCSVYLWELHSIFSMHA